MCIIHLLALFCIRLLLPNVGNQLIVLVKIHVELFSGIFYLFILCNIKMLFCKTATVSAFVAIVFTKTRVFGEWLKETVEPFVVKTVLKCIGELNSSSKSIRFPVIGAFKETFHRPDRIPLDYCMPTLNFKKMDANRLIILHILRPNPS